MMFTSSFNLDLSEASIIEIIDAFDQTVSQEVKENGGFPNRKVAVFEYAIPFLP